MKKRIKNRRLMMLEHCSWLPGRRGRRAAFIARMRLGLPLPKSRALFYYDRFHGRIAANKSYHAFGWQLMNDEA